MLADEGVYLASELSVAADDLLTLGQFSVGANNSVLNDNCRGTKHLPQINACNLQTNP